MFIVPAFKGIWMAICWLFGPHPVKKAEPEPQHIIGVDTSADGDQSWDEKYVYDDPSETRFVPPVLTTNPYARVKDKTQLAGDLLAEALAKANVKGAGTVYVRFDEEGNGTITESTDQFGPDIVIKPVSAFPLRPRPVQLASSAMLAIQDNKTFPSDPRCSSALGDMLTRRGVLHGRFDTWPTMEATCGQDRSRT